MKVFVVLLNDPNNGQRRFVGVGATDTAARQIVVDDLSEHDGGYIADNYDILESEVEGGTSSDLRNRIMATADRLSSLAMQNEEVQFAVDDLIYDNIGTGKHGSDINNEGIQGQAEALIERIGEQATLDALFEVETRFVRTTR